MCHLFNDVMGHFYLNIGLFVRLFVYLTGTERIFLAVPELAIKLGDICSPWAGDREYNIFVKSDTPLISKRSHFKSRVA